MNNPETELWTVYLLECSDESYYCGTCKDHRLMSRIQEHNKGIGSRYTRSRLPVRLLAKTRPLDKQSAYQVEYRTKKMARTQKKAFLDNI
jgi:putative endonuclease